MFWERVSDLRTILRPSVSPAMAQVKEMQIQPQHVCRNWADDVNNYTKVASSEERSAAKNAPAQNMSQNGDHHRAEKNAPAKEMRQN